VITTTGGLVQQWFSHFHSSTSGAQSHSSSQTLSGAYPASDNSYK
jgi:hypothetical protein